MPGRNIVVSGSRGAKLKQRGPKRSCYRPPGRDHGARTRTGQVGGRGEWVGKERQPENRKGLSRIQAGMIL